MNKKKKIFIIICVCVILIVGLIAIGFTLNESNIIKLNKKISKLQKCLINDNELSITDDSCVVFISISDINTKAYVVNSEGNNLNDAISKTKKKAKSIVKQYNLNPELVKIDVVNNQEQMTEDELKSEIKQYKENYYRKGIAFDKNYNTALLDSELNSNEIINYKKGSLIDSRLNNYLESSNKGLKKLDNIGDDLYTFTCISYAHNNEYAYKISSEENSYGIRKIDNLDDSKCLEIINNASQYLVNVSKSNGQFQYDYDPIVGKTQSGYNIVRHNGTIWSMIEAYKLTHNEDLKSKIDNAIKYVVNECIVERDENISYIIEPKDDEVKLGANGIGVLMLVEYMETFETDEYKDITEKLGNGILSMQLDDGSYFHVLGYPDYSKVAMTRTVYYDGEATFALAKLYGYTKDEKWLKSAEKAMDYFCKNNYVQYRDHWIEYSVNEVTKYSPKEEYFELGLKNVSENLQHIMEAIVCGPTNLELLTKGLEIYDRAEEKNIDTKNFKVSELIDAIYYRAFYQLNGFFFDEVAIYFKNPQKIIGAFFAREDDFRVRIDDVQHNINGYYNLYNDFNLINKYSSTN